MADLPKAPPNPHQESIDKLAGRVLPIIRAMPFAQNRKEPWLGNATVDKAVIATITTCFALADQDRLLAEQSAAAETVSEEAEPEALPAPEQLPEVTNTSDT
jgi:hypothetical protein